MLHVLDMFKGLFTVFVEQTMHLSFKWNQQKKEIDRYVVLRLNLVLKCGTRKKIAYFKFWRDMTEGGNKQKFCVIPEDITRA